MDQLIALLTNLLNLTKVAAVTLPGLLLAGALTVLFWPPALIDLIPVAFPHNEKGSRPATQGGPEPKSKSIACDVKLVPLSRAWELGILSDNDDGSQVAAFASSQGPDLNQGLNPKGEPPNSPRLFAQINLGREEPTSPSVKYQLLLDAEQIRLSECIAAETALKGREKTENDQLAQELAIRGKGQRYSGQIDETRTHILNNEQAIRDQDRDLASLERHLRLIDSRLADPGRLRPRLDFNAFVALQTAHVIGFILLSIALGLIIVPIRDALFGLFADRLLDYLWPLE